MWYLHWQQWWRHTWASGLKKSHRPNVKYTGQELGGELCDIFKYLSLLYSKSVKNDCELSHLLGDFVPDPLTVLGSVHHGWLSVVQTPSAIYSPQITISGITKKWTWWCEIFLLLLYSYSPHPWSHISFSSCTGIRNHIYSFYKQYCYRLRYTEKQTILILVSR